MESLYTFLPTTSHRPSWSILVFSLRLQAVRWSSHSLGYVFLSVPQTGRYNLGQLLRQTFLTQVARPEMTLQMRGGSHSWSAHSAVEARQQE